MPSRSTLTVPPLLLAIVSNALFGPSVAGVKTMPIVVDPPPPIDVAPGAPTENCDASAPVITNGGVSVIGAVLKFATVTSALADDPTATDPKSCGAGVAPIRAGTGALLRFCGALGEMSAKSLPLLFVSTECPAPTTGL